METSHEQSTNDILMMILNNQNGLKQAILEQEQQQATVGSI
jgi:hypothetical protein